jgi:PAS domain S-box-containing protein
LAKKRRIAKHNGTPAKARITHERSHQKKHPRRVAVTSTNQQQVEQTLQEVQRWFQQIIEYNANLFYYYRPSDHTMLYLSPQALRFLDAEPKEALAGWDHFFEENPGNAQKRERARELLLAGKTPSSYELEIHTKKKRIVWVEVNEIPVVRNNITVAAVGTLMDITERKKVHDALSRYQLLADNANDIIYFSSPDGIILEANHAAVKSYGYSHKELLTMHIRDLRSPESVADIENQLRQAIAGGLIFETIQRRKDGTTFPVEISARGAEINNKKIVVSVVRDITDRKQTEEALEHRLLVLTRPLEDEPAELHFEDLLNLEEVQVIQDAFAAATGVASIITDVNGKPITRPSNFCHLCEHIIRKTEKGLANCYYSDAAIGRKIIDAPVMQPCLSGGLWDGGSNIFVGNRHIANWLIGQVLDKDSDEKKMMHYAHEIGADETEFREALKHVTHMPKEQFEKVCYALHLIAQQISNLAFQNIQQAREITRRKHAEKALQESKERLRLLSDATFEGIAITENGIFIDVNDQFLQMHQYRREELIGAPVLTVIAPRSREVVAAAFQSDNFGPYQHFALRKDGSEITVEARARLLHIDNRKIRIAAVRDITENKRAEKALQESEERSRLLADATFEGIVIAENGCFIDVNKQILSMLGYRREELIGKSILTTISPQSQSIVADAVQADRTEPYEHFALCKDGKEISVESRARIFYSNGRKMRMTAVRDITERKHAEEALRQAQKMESLGVLAGGIAHDFNNLLQAIIGQAYLALTKLPAEHPVRENIEKAQLAATRAADLTRQLLAYSGHGKFLVKTIELNVFIQEIFHLLEIAIPKNVELHLNTIEPTLYFNADVAQMQQVLLNLVVNAAEAMEGTVGTVTIRTYRQVITEENLSLWNCGNVAPKPGTYIVLDVEDTGYGMDQPTIEKIFDPFFTTKFTGRGLGLAAVLGIIRGHEGGLQVESRKNAGTRFRIAFPQASPPQSVITEPKPAIAPQLSGTILFVDDEPSVREAFVDAFAQSKINVLTAKNGEEGIVLYKRHREKVSIIILDLSMPGMGGEAAFKALRLINPHVKIMISSGYAEEDVVKQFAGLEITGFLQKPYPWDKLHQLLAEHLNILTL